SLAIPAAIVAMTVGLVVRLLTSAVSVLGPPLTVTVLVPPAVPLIVTSVPVKPLTGSLNTAVKLMVGTLVGSAWLASWSIVPAGGWVSGGVKLTLLSVLVEAVLRLPAASCATPAVIVAITVPALLIPLSLPVALLISPLTVTVLVPPAVPPIVTSVPVKPLTGSLNTAVKL